MLNIIKRIIIGTGIALCVFLIKENVFAATTLYSSRYRNVYKDAVCVPVTLPSGTIQSCMPDPTQTDTTTSSLIQFGTATSGPKYIYANVIQFTSNSNTSQYFQAGQQCTISFTSNWNPRNDSTDQFMGAATEGIPLYYNGSSYVAMPGQVNVSKKADNYGYQVNYTFVVPQSTQNVQLQINYSSDGILRNSSTQGLNFKDATLTCATNSTDQAVQDAANQISGAVNGAGSQAHIDAQSMLAAIQSIGDQFNGTGTSPSGTVSRNNVYSNSGLAQKEGQVNWEVDDDAFDLDLQPFSTPISFIWLQVTTFINLDPLFLSLIIACLVVSFIALVVGRT